MYSLNLQYLVLNIVYLINVNRTLFMLIDTCTYLHLIPLYCIIKIKTYRRIYHNSSNVIFTTILIHHVISIIHFNISIFSILNVEPVLKSQRVYESSKESFNIRTFRVKKLRAYFRWLSSSSYIIISLHKLCAFIRGRINYIITSINV